jgi:uncharacterized damage-inducible protein DinB
MTTTTPTSLKQHYLAAYDRETATTLRVLKAFPAEHSEMRPHPTSMSARELGWIFAIEQGASMAVLNDAMTMPPDPPPPPPATFAEVVDAFQGMRDQLRELVEATPEDALASTFRFVVAPKTLGDVAKMDFLWLMLNDQIHHRGQLSVYLRMTGSKVPSIYGPSRDEPWF